MDRRRVLVALVSWLNFSWSCDPDFCVSRTHGETYVDPTDPTHYYECVWDRALYRFCHDNLVFNGEVCDFPTAGATTAAALTDTSSGVLDSSGYCVATVTGGTATSGTTQSTSNYVSTYTSTTGTATTATPDMS